MRRGDKEGRRSSEKGRQNVRRRGGYVRKRTKGGDLREENDEGRQNVRRREERRRSADA